MNGYTIPKLFAKELIKEKIDYEIELEIEPFRDYGTYRHFRFIIRSKKRQDEIIMVNKTDKGDDNYKIRIWNDYIVISDYGFDIAESFNYLDAVRYIKHAVTKRILIWGIEKDTKMNIGRYVDLEDINQLDKIKTKMQKIMNIEEICDFNGDIYEEWNAKEKH